MLPTTLGHALYNAGYRSTVMRSRPAHLPVYGAFDPNAASFAARWGQSLAATDGNFVGERASLEGLQKAIAAGLIPNLPNDYIATHDDLDDMKVLTLTRTGRRTAYDDLVPDEPAPAVTPEAPHVEPGPGPTPEPEPEPEPIPGPTPGPVIVPTDPPPVRPSVEHPFDVFDLHPELRQLNAADIFRPERGVWFLQAIPAEAYPVCDYVQWVADMAAKGHAWQMGVLRGWLLVAKGKAT